MRILRQKAANWQSCKSFQYQDKTSFFAQSAERAPSVRRRNGAHNSRLHALSAFRSRNKAGRAPRRLGQNEKSRAARKPRLKAGSFVFQKIKIRHSQAPAYWRRVTEGRLSATRLNEIELVLSANGISYRLVGAGRRREIYVPALLETRARREIEAYDRENSPKPPARKPWPLHKDWPLAPLYALFLIFWHGMAVGWFPSYSGFPDPNLWQKLGLLDAIEVLWHGEWSRLCTALFLHAGLAHLTGNVFFGAFFLALLARLCGFGHAWLLTCLGGIGGNLISVLAHKPGYASIGFSTAVFATVGVMAGVLLWRMSEKIFMPFAAALAFLAMLGVEGANTDYAAHICGLTFGGILGLLEGCALRHDWPMLPQNVAAVVAILIPATAWILRFNQIC